MKVSGGGFNERQRLLSGEPFPMDMAWSTLTAAQGLANIYLY